MRFDVKKFLFIGIAEEKEAFFKKAQELGFIHFMNMSGTEITTGSPEVDALVKAIKILRGFPPTEQEEIESYPLADAFAAKILQLKDHLEKLEEQKRLLGAEIERVKIFGDFSPADVAFIEKEGKRKIQFFFAKKGTPVPVSGPQLIYIGTEQELDYFVSVNPEPVSVEKMVEMPVTHPLGELVERYHNAEKDIHETENHLKSYAKYNDFLHRALPFKLNTKNLHAAKNYVKTELEGGLFAVEGWVPVTSLHQLDNLVDRMHVRCEEIAVEKTDVIPTYLENTGLARIGQDVIGIYDTPSTKDKDPSLWVLWGFAVFFAFIVNDGGYGLLFLALAAYLHRKFPKVKATGKRVIKLITLLGFSCFVWGLLTTSFFGIDFAPNNPIRKVSLLGWLAEKNVAFHMHNHDDSYREWIKKYPRLKNVTDPKQFIEGGYTVEGKEKSYTLRNDVSDNILFELALFIGVVHIILSFLRYLPRQWAGLGWIIFMVGAYLYFPYFLGVPSLLNYVGNLSLAEGGTIGLHLMEIGIPLALIAAVVQHRLRGLGEITSVIQIFADVMSYLRLYALGLAGGIVSLTINNMAGSLPLVFAVILIVLAHLTNITLAVVSGIIHGLRLNFLEWYHYSFEGGGREFKALKLLKPE